MLLPLILALLMLVCGCSGSPVDVVNGDRKIAVTVGKNQIDNVEMMYQYKEAISNFYNENYQLVSMLGIDFTGDLSTQEVSNGQTWRDFFIENAIYAVQEENYLKLAAEDAGFELSAEQVAEVKKSCADFYAQLEAYGYELESYLKTNYGPDITVEDFEQYVMNDAISFYYYQKLISDISVDDEALNAYYEANKNAFDSVDFHIYHFAYTVPEVAEGEEAPADESYKNEAKAEAEKALASINSIDEFEPYVRSILPADQLAVWTEDYSFATTKQGEVFTELENWLFDPARTEGDKTVFEYNNGYFVTMFGERYLEDYRTVDVRHCLIKTGTVSTILVEGTDEIDYEATAAAQAQSDSEKLAKAEELLNNWVAGGASEEAFIKMANENSEDGAVDGLYTKVLKGEMVKEFEDWCFDSSRQPGDYGIVKTQYGYHIMYFSAYNEVEWKLNAKETIRQAEYEKLYESFGEKYPVIKNQDVLKDIK